MEVKRYILKWNYSVRQELGIHVLLIKDGRVLRRNIKLKDIHEKELLFFVAIQIDKFTQ